MILLDPFWTEFLPIWVWVIEHPEGILVIDTGENTSVSESNYFNCGGIGGWINKKILRFDITSEDEIGNQLLKIGIRAEDVRQVILTHLHIDHTDGLKYFPQAEILVSEQEWNKPYGAVPCTFPAWLNPRRVTYLEKDRFFGQTYSVTKDKSIQLVPTPGHSHGHQSVILRTSGVDVFFAGDTSFDEAQLVKGQAAGICIDKQRARQTLQQIQNYCRHRPVVYLPSHDPLSVYRLQHKQITLPTHPGR